MHHSVVGSLDLEKLQLKPGIGGWMGRSRSEVGLSCGDRRTGLWEEDLCAIARVDGGVRRSQQGWEWSQNRLLGRVRLVLVGISRGQLTVEVEGVTNSRQNNSVGHLSKKVVLEIGVVDDCRRRKTAGHIASGFEGDEFWYWDLLFKT